jgi:predicted 2-oxoglutarate/Fe(II)-dependent dioxygenase YbiX
MGRRRQGLEPRPLIEEPEFYRVHAALHVLWTKAAERDDYDKKEWLELDNAISALGHKAFG